MLYKKCWHSRLVHADADAVTRYPGLCHFKYCRTDAVAIPDADLIIRKPLNSEVFPELAETKIVSAQKAFPVMVGLHLVNEYGTLLAAVAGEKILGTASYGGEPSTPQNSRYAPPIVRRPGILVEGLPRLVENILLAGKQSGDI